MAIDAPQEREHRGAIVRLGVLAVASVAELGAAAMLLGRALRGMRRLEGRELARHAYAFGNRSLLFVAVGMSCTGAILIVQASLQARRLFGDLSAIGPIFLQLLVREFAPTITAMMVAARYGAGIAAELGAMTITEQVDALRMAGERPAEYLVTPRLVAGLVAMLALVVWGAAIAFAAGGLAAFYGFGIGFDVYARLDLVRGADLGVGLVKTLFYGLAVPLVASQAGLAARGGAAGVGRATTRAVVGSSLSVLVLDLLVGGAAQVLGV